MNNMELKRRKQKINLNIAPLIDVVFLLLIFFVLSYHFVVHRGLKITLPEATTASHQKAEDIIIYITEDNQLYLNEQRIDIENLLDSLKSKVKHSQEQTVIIKADKKIDLGLAVKVMDIANKAEAKGLVISTQTKENVQ